MGQRSVRGPTSSLPEAGVLQLRVGKPIRVVLADDHRLVREALRGLLAGYADLQVVAEVASGRDLLGIVAGNEADCVVVDIAMPELNGLDAIRVLRQRSPTLGLVVLSMHESRRFVTSAIRLGANGYVPKTAASEDLVAAIRAAAMGRSYLSQEVMTVVTEQVRRGGDVARDSDDSLSGREREVLQMIGEGRGLAEIGRLLHISTKTVRNHRDHISRKLGCNTTAALVKQAIRLGLTTS